MVAVLIMGQCNVNVGADRSSILSPHAFVVVSFRDEEKGLRFRCFNPQACLFSFEDKKPVGFAK